MRYLVIIFLCCVPFGATAQITYPQCSIGNAENSRVLGSDVRVREAIEAAAICNSPNPTASCTQDLGRGVILNFMRLQKRNKAEDIDQCMRACRSVLSIARQSRLTDEDMEFFYLTQNVKTACRSASGHWRASVCVQHGWFSCTYWMNLPR